MCGHVSSVCRRRSQDMRYVGKTIMKEIVWKKRMDKEQNVTVVEIMNWNGLNAPGGWKRPRLPKSGQLRESPMWVERWSFSKGPVVVKTGRPTRAYTIAWVSTAGHRNDSCEEIHFMVMVRNGTPKVGRKLRKIDIIVSAAELFWSHPLRPQAWVRYFSFWRTKEWECIYFFVVCGVM